MSFERYEVHDAYTETELLVRFQASDTAGRVSLIQEVLRSARSRLPHSVEDLAARDPSPLVRWTLARGARWISKENQRALSADEFLRATLLECSEPIFGHEEVFAAATHLERCAFARSLSMLYTTETLVLPLFEDDAAYFGISEKERGDIRIAFLSNPHLGKLSEKDRRAIWERATKMDRKYADYLAVLEHVSVDDTTRAACYSNEKDARARHAMLENCSAKDVKTLALAVADQDADCRRRAQALGAVDLNSAKTFGEWQTRVKRQKEGFWRSTGAGFLLSLVNIPLVILAVYIYWNSFLAPAVRGARIGLVGAVGIVMLCRILWPGHGPMRQALQNHANLLRGSFLLYATIRWLAPKPPSERGSGRPGILSNEVDREGALPDSWTYSSHIERWKEEFLAVLNTEPNELPPAAPGSFGEVFVSATIPLLAALGLAAALHLVQQLV